MTIYQGYLTTILQKYYYVYVLKLIAQLTIPKKIDQILFFFKLCK